MADLNSEVKKMSAFRKKLHQRYPMLPKHAITGLQKGTHSVRVSRDGVATLRRNGSGRITKYGVSSEAVPTVHNKHAGTAPRTAVYIGRGSPFGNPFVIGRDGTRDEVCDKYARMLESNKELRSLVKEKLAGKDLVCFCKPSRCHGDTLLEVANG